MQVSKKHFPAVGLLTLVLIGIAAGSIAYYQFIVPQAKTCGAPVHRVIFMRALVQEVPFNGFSITGAAIFNETGSPLPVAANYTSQDPRLNFTGVRLENYTVTNQKTIEANVGDLITIYVMAVNATVPPQYPTALGHGLGIDQFSIPNPIRLVDWGTWASTTFTVTSKGFSTYRCLHVCSDAHGSMTGSLAVSGCA
jgi:hypothetical protein